MFVIVASVPTLYALRLRTAGVFMQHSLTISFQHAMYSYNQVYFIVVRQVGLLKTKDFLT